jgi:putative thioredoxin
VRLGAYGCYEQVKTSRSRQAGKPGYRRVRRERTTMSNQPGRPAARPAASPAVNLRGAVDLSALAARGQQAAPTAGPAAASGSAPVIDVSDADFAAQVVQRSTTVPVVIDFWAEWCAPCRQLSPVLERLAVAYGGRFLLAKVDIDASPQLAQAFAVQSIPSVFAVIKGQPVPLFQGAQPEAQIRQVLEELLRVAGDNGVTGVYTAGGSEESAVEEQEVSLPPLHQKAYDAIEAGDFDGACDAYEQALRETPADEQARVGLAQVRLLQRTQSVDQLQARAAAADRPLDVEAQLLVADLDLLSGHVEDAFARLVDIVRATSGADRDRARVHLVELFDVVGPEDSRVGKARVALANALF